MKVKFKKLCPEAVAPKKGTSGSAGFDFTAVGFDLIDALTIRYHTGIAVEIPRGYVGLVFPRSSVFRAGLMLTNCVGVIDSDYRGEVTAVFIRERMCPDRYDIGDRIFQLVIVPIPDVELEETDELSATARGVGGYGSTGR